MGKELDWIARLYRQRFSDQAREAKSGVWAVLVREFFEQWIRPNDTVLDLGCGYGEFINEIRCGKKFALDLNPDAPGYLDPSIQFLEQDCSTPWQLESDSLDVVFTSNFFEHLPDKETLG